MKSSRVSSFPSFTPMASSSSNNADSEGINTNARLLLKLIQDHLHQEAAAPAAPPGDEDQRLLKMITVLDELKKTILATQSSGKTQLSQLRRSYTAYTPASTNNTPEMIDQLEDKDKLRKELNASFAAQRRLALMCSTLGKEKQIVAKELALKVQELQELEELVNDLKEQNDRLGEKVKVCALHHKEKGTTYGGGGGKLEVPSVNVSALQERNKELSEQLLRTLEGYKFLKRKLKEVHEDNLNSKADMAKVREEVASGITFIHDSKEILAARNQVPLDIKGHIGEIEGIFERLAMKISKQN